MDISPIGPDETVRAVDALRVLWPNYAPDEMRRVVDDVLRPGGYRLVGILPEPGEPAVCVLGYRFQHSLWLGKSLYIVDIATVPKWRGRGFADRMVEWSEAEAVRQGCAAVHLDSGVGADREAAHRLYMRHHYRIGCHHFIKRLDAVAS